MDLNRRQHAPVRREEMIMTDDQQMTTEEIASLPLNERILYGLSTAGFDESEVDAALAVVLPLMAADLRELAHQVEWKHRAMTFYRGGPGCSATTRLHPVGRDVREYADALSPLPADADLPVADAGTSNEEERRG